MSSLPKINRIPRLLAISDPEERSAADDSLEIWLCRLADVGIDAVQLREKQLDDRRLHALACVARRAWPRTLLVNGRIDIALGAGADGVHLPASEVPIAPLRRRFGSRILIGRSTHHPREVAEARRAGADYVTFGPIFPTPSKARYGRPPGLEGLRRAAEEDIPVLALGGIGPEELAPVLDAGAVGVAGIRAFHDPEILKRWAGARRAAWKD